MPPTDLDIVIIIRFPYQVILCLLPQRLLLGDLDRQAKVADLDIEVVIEKEVPEFEVTVDDLD